jgi:hypothetical protein
MPLVQKVRLSAYVPIGAQVLDHFPLTVETIRSYIYVAHTGHNYSG